MDMRRQVFARTEIVYRDTPDQIHIVACFASASNYAHPVISVYILIHFAQERVSLQGWQSL